MTLVLQVAEEYDVKEKMDRLTYQIVLRRKLVFFTYILLLPCIFLTMLTMVIFWLPPERPDKTTLGKCSRIGQGERKGSQE